MSDEPKDGEVVSFFKRLAAAAGKTWDNVDPDEFVRELRGEDELDSDVEPLNATPEIPQPHD